jgi:hypothetical protein
MKDKFFISQYPQFNLEQYLLEKDLSYQIHDSDTHCEISINCPECHKRGEPSPDRKKKLWINPEKGTFYCYRCSFSGGLVHLVKSISQCNFTQSIKLLRGRSINPLEHFELNLFDPDLKIKMHDEELELKEIELPYGYQPIDGPVPYLEERGIPWKYAMKNDWGISTAGYTKNRIIVPSFMEGKLVFWQARSTWEVSGDEKKVLNPSGVSARSVLYNFDIAKEYETIIIVEGFADAVKVGPNAVATNGKNLHPQQLLWLEKTNAKEIILCWDYDAWTDGKVMKGKNKPSSIEKASSLLKSANFEKIKAVKLPEGRDPGSFKYRSLKLQDLISKAITL